jgi:hypothetical protein
MPLRDSIAHAATPWDWRSRAAVVALVVVAIAVPVAFIIEAWIDADGTNRLMALFWYGGLGSLLAVRPALRALRRWDESHNATADTP